jgi:hypothetical protein
MLHIETYTVSKVDYQFPVDSRVYSFSCAPEHLYVWKDMIILGDSEALLSSF